MPRYIIRETVRLYPIPNFPDYYASKCGRVWSEKRRGRFLRLRKRNQYGYLAVMLYVNGKRFLRLIHRLVLETFIGPCPEGMECCHNNGDPVDNRLNNLRWDSHSNNAKDAVRHGTHSLVKLNVLQVRIIRRLLEFGELTRREIGEIFGVGRANISHIKSRKSWSHV